MTVNSGKFNNFKLVAPPPDDEPPNFEDEFPPDDISEGSL